MGIADGFLQFPSGRAELPALHKSPFLKKISARQRQRQVRLCQRRFNRRLRRARRYSEISQISPLAEGFYSPPRSASKMLVPERFDFDHSEGEVLRWLNSAFSLSDKAIRKFVKTGRRRPKKVRIASYYDFTQIQSITPAVALVIAAFFDRHRQLSGTPIQVYNYNIWNPRVRSVLRQVGFFDLLGVSLDADLGSEPEPSAKIERFTSERQLQSEELGRLVDKLLAYLLAANPDCLSTDEKVTRTAKLFSALVEATENTRRHAYPQDTHGGFTVLPNWWLTGVVDPAERRLTLIVYDQGVSVPGSLMSTRVSTWPGHRMINRIIARFSRGEFDPDDPISDHAKLRLAMKLGQSSTGERHRGKGLPVVRDAIQHCERGRLYILSRNGGYLEETGKRATSWSLEAPMPGTLIVWDLWL